MRTFFTSALAAIVGLFAPVAGSIQGALILPELVKAVAAGIAVGSLTAGVAAGLNVVAADSAALTTNQVAATLVAFIFAHLAAQVLMLGRGAKPSAVAAVALAEAIEPDVLPFARVEHPEFGPVRSECTPRGVRGPIFDTPEGQGKWELAGKPKVRGLGL